MPTLTILPRLNVVELVGGLAVDSLVADSIVTARDCCFEKRDCTTKFRAAEYNVTETSVREM